MTILTLNKKQLESKIGKMTEDLQNKISMFGTPIEEVTDNEVSIEVFPNRPDLLSFQGFVRAITAFLKKPGLKTYKVEKPQKDYQVTIENSVKKVRPFTACAIIKGLKFDEEKIKEVVEIQEKLHGSYGRNRKKLAVGVYPLEEITLPIKFLALKPESIRFQPLEFPREINGRQILSQHPTGREYGHLLEGADIYPIFIDGAGEVLSMPPIINSHKTGKINEKTKDIFIECSGFHKEYLKKTLNMIVTALADMGGKIYAMEVIDKTKEISPQLSPEKMPFSIEYINKNLGLDLKEKEIKSLLAKMGIGYVKEKNKPTALIPAYRTDILHEVDLVEEVAIAYGYDKFDPIIPKISTIGQEDPESIKKRKIAQILAGLGLQEISTYHLSTKEKQFKKINKDYKSADIIEVIDSKTENNILRNSLLANSIQILSENSDASYPQKIFELGRIFFTDNKTETGVEESENLCITLCHEKANFTELKQILDYLMRMLDKKYEMKETSHPSFIEGRCGKISIDNKDIGIIGEIKPIVLKNNKIKMPTASIEIKINAF
ncbi:phenylalanine--tRNA ligase subunit beta [Candidatus Pacearchaeota archaeon]|nr:phenylalanine--tRNA ligase subunit beta [Candidatus Pacearchaeota archaeon]